MNSFEQLHPSLQYHIVNSLGWSTLRPTQLEAIEPIHNGEHCLLLAPTAGGKTEAAVIPVLSRMLREEWPATSVLYICPIKALLNNLEQRLTYYAGLVGRTVQLWHGDIGQSQKQRALRDPPDILLTTPESVEGMLVSTRVERATWFGNVRAVVIDELHAFASDDRGWHLRALLQRLQKYTAAPVQRIGLSATVGNPEDLLAWLAPIGSRRVVGSGSVSTDADVTLDYVGSIENAGLVISRLHRGRKRLVFCDSRSAAERIGSQLRGYGVRTFVSHASLSADARRQAETAFAEEKDCVIVATSTLELGIDVGDLDYVIQIDAPSTVSSFLQRMGRTGRRTGSRRNCLFLATSDHALLQALAIAEQWSRAWVEDAVAPPEPWNIVAQQALAATLEAGIVVRSELVAELNAAFPECELAGVESLLDHLLALTYLTNTDGLVQIGPKTESEYGRGHYRDLLASFSGTLLLIGRHGASDIGFIDPTVVSGEDANGLVLLGGRSWRVTSVEWKKRIAWLAPADSGGKARWMGSARSIGPELSAAVRRVLARGSIDIAVLSKRAKDRLDELRDEIPVGSDASQNVLEVGDQGAARIWTFAGTKHNRTLARQLRAHVGPCRFDEYQVSARTDVHDALTSLVTASIHLAPSEIVELSKGLKFASCVTGALCHRELVARFFDTSDFAGVTARPSEHEA